MTVLVTADLHFSTNPRDAYRHGFVPYLRKVLEKQQVEHLLILGDLTEEKDKHGAWLVNMIVEHMRSLAECCPITILQGNHDAVDPVHPFFYFLGQIGDGRRVRWVNSPTERKLPSLGTCLFLPHTREYERDWDGLCFENYSYIFAHATFKGVRVGSAPPLNGVPTSVFPKDARVIAGDIHAPVRIGCVEYVGAPYLVDFGDDYEPRVLLLDGHKLPRSIKCPGPQKRLIEVDDVSDVSNALSGCVGDVVRVRVRVTKDRVLDLWPTIRDEVISMCERSNCILSSVQPVLVDDGKMHVVAGPARRRRSSDSELVEVYCARVGAPDRVLRIGKEFL